MITINPIADALAQDIVVLNLDSGNNIVYCYSSSEAISEGYGTNHVVRILPLTQEPQMAVPLT